jgi:hypothetical protein
LKLVEAEEVKKEEVKRNCGYEIRNLFEHITS